MSEFLAVGQTVRLVGRTQHGKNRVREHGDRWTVEQFLHWKALMRSQLTGDTRWVGVMSDRHFDIRGGEL